MLATATSDQSTITEKSLLDVNAGLVHSLPSSDFLPISTDPRPSKVLPADAKTPDKWICRDERLIRLTGAHPFNCEPPLTVLFDQGFITPDHLHFVRNHGPVAEVTDEELSNWSVSIEGLVDNPQVIRLNQLKETFETVTLPITLACAGNRRKEQNMVRKSKGFNWGAAGTSTSFWTGALLCDVLRTAKPRRNARYVIFEGHEDLPNGKYSTGIRLKWAMDFDRGIILAWKQNGEFLSPDHGRPLRVVIPGVIGGRSVKWLRRIIVSDQPPDGWYHKYDNRVIPTTITPEMSTTSEEWWTDERYAIYNLNLQSVIVIPEHNSTLSKDSAASEFTLKGYAYNGGGIQVSRVEISLDAGKTWIQAKIRYPEDQLRELNASGQLTELYGGTVDLADRYLSFCWCFWELSLPTKDILDAKDIVVRGMDLNMVAQPRDMYWSVLGMLGNWWYRLALIDEGSHVKFVHPTNLKASDGWMDLMKEQGRDPSQWFAEMAATLTENEVKSPKKEVKMTQDDKMDVIISARELASHENWFVVKGQVYDGTGFLQDHPGGPESITMVSGDDVTEDFMAIHSENAKKQLADFHIGRLDTTETERATEAASSEPATISPTFLNPKQWKKTKLVKRVDVSSDTRLFEFELESPEQTSGLPVGAHVFIRTKDGDGEIVMRAYTPISCHRTQGRLILLVKVYFPTQNAPGGRMGMLLEKLKVSDSIEIKGPTGSFNYLGKGDVLHRGEKLHVSKFYMVSGGSGITPCYQVMKEVATDNEDSTSCHLLFGNRERPDVMCYDELEDFKAKANGRIVIDYYLSRPNDSNRISGFTFKTGRVDHSVLSSAIEINLLRNDAMLLVCGPPGMVEATKSWAEEHEIARNRLVVF